MTEHASGRRLYLLPAGSGRESEYLAFSPLIGICLLVDQGDLPFLQSLEAGRPHPTCDRQREYLQLLAGAGFLRPESELAPSRPEIESEYLPTDVGISPTADCNLQCTYCYSRAGDVQATLELEVAQKAVDMVAGNAIKTGKRIFEINFYGGGEPTTNWVTMVGTVNYACKIAESNALNVEFATVTNGVMSKRKAQWLATHMNKIGVSWDGPPEFQDLHRPTRSGKGSFSRVFETIKFLDSSGVDYSLRCAVSDLTVSGMVGVVDFVHDNFRPSYLQFEPVKEVGRGRTSVPREPPPRVFAREYVRALQRAKQLGIKLGTSVATLTRKSSHFCGVQRGRPLLTPTGHLTLCTEVTDPKGRAAGQLIYGRYNPATKQFDVDRSKLNAAVTTTVMDQPQCANCFCRWSCAGGCVHSSESIHLRQSMSRCHITRETTLALLQSHFQNGYRVFLQRDWRQ